MHCTAVGVVTGSNTDLWGKKRKVSVNIQMHKQRQRPVHWMASREQKVSVERKIEKIGRLMITKRDIASPMNGMKTTKDK